MLIEPTNRKLKFFNLLVAVMLVYDFLLSGFILSNYDFHNNPENFDHPNVKAFAHHKTSYFFICMVQSFDILLNFCKIEITPTRKIDDPKELFSNYIKGTFVVDVIAIIPYSIVRSEYIFLRYLKIVSFDRYLSYFSEVFYELFMNILS